MFAANLDILQFVFLLRIFILFIQDLQLLNKLASVALKVVVVKRLAGLEDIFHLFFL